MMVDPHQNLEIFKYAQETEAEKKIPRIFERQKNSVRFYQQITYLFSRLLNRLHLIVLSIIQSFNEIGLSLLKISSST